MVMRQEPTGRWGVQGETTAEIAKSTVAAVAELVREHIELARVEVGGELEVTVKRALWWGAALAGGALGAILLVIALFLLAGYIVPSPGVRLLILAAIVFVGAVACVLQGTSLRRPPLRSDVVTTSTRH